ncbi:hypothetical protein E2C01_074739 [Portunus trituberculatus]|uniref:Uncharacterized protein n=1 Tax=Portunus trituberculatus TaxID=210409 RepID=A0A5B7I6F1_PORTR|nr:hypothetical protein [Portunus trituberculatus]
MAFTTTTTTTTVHYKAVGLTGRATQFTQYIPLRLAWRITLNTKTDTQPCIASLSPASSALPLNSSHASNQGPLAPLPLVHSHAGQAWA